METTVPPTQPTELSGPAAEYATAREALVTNLPKAKDFKLPDNYKTVEDYADALLSAQKGFTQARQELAAYKKAEAEAKAAAAAILPSEVATPEDELIISKPTTPPVPNVGKEVTKADWDRWSEVIVENGYTINDTIRSEIKARLPGLPEEVMTQYVNGLRSSEALKFGQAANLVGGREVLQGMLKWASDTMNEATARQVTKDLKGPNGNFVLLGLKVQYEQAMAKSAAEKAAKPTRPPAIAPQQAVNAGQRPQPFSSVTEQSASLLSPLYAQDPGYRSMVDQRVLATRLHGYGKTV